VTDHLTMRGGGPNDSGVLIDLFDDAVAWLVAGGQPEQQRRSANDPRPYRSKICRFAARKS
jgi:hypothetical protein